MEKSKTTEAAYFLRKAADMLMECKIVNVLVQSTQLK